MSKEERGMNINTTNSVGASKANASRADTAYLTNSPKKWVRLPKLHNGDEVVEVVADLLRRGPR